MDRDGKGWLMIRVVWKVDSVVLFQVEVFMVPVSDSNAFPWVLIPP